MKTWALQDAKARLSELVRAAGKEPQTITLRGEEKAVVISPEEYRHLQKKKKGKDMTLQEILEAAPTVPEFEPPTRKGRMRPIDL